jgi:hypothetical protein
LKSYSLYLEKDTLYKTYQTGSSHTQPVTIKLILQTLFEYLIKRMGLVGNLTSTRRTEMNMQVIAEDTGKKNITRKFHRRWNDNIKTDL